MKERPDDHCSPSESVTIIDYLADRSDSAHLLVPGDTHYDGWIRYRYWLHYAEEYRSSIWIRNS